MVISFLTLRHSQVRSGPCRRPSADGGAQLFVAGGIGYNLKNFFNAPGGVSPRCAMQHQIPNLGRCIVSRRTMETSDVDARACAPFHIMSAP
jgi:hypothetical protein